jgi:endogenous inhibitor of DNA gyrase (YacG/DUF329 family)
VPSCPNCGGPLPAPKLRGRRVFCSDRCRVVSWKRAHNRAEALTDEELAERLQREWDALEELRGA